MRPMPDLLAEVKDRHFPLPPSSGDAISQLEQRIGCALPDDLREFYVTMGGAQLFRANDAPYEILEPELVRYVKLDVFGEDAEDLSVPRTWFSLCYVQDGNYVAIDLPPKPSGEVWMIDCFHEALGLEDHSTIIALSFSEFLQRALASAGKHYWLGEHPSHGDAFRRAPR